MLNIYLEKELIPKDLKYVFDNELYFGAYPVNDTPENRMIIEHIEQGKFVDNAVFEDRFKGRLYLSLLSTSSKILLNVQNNPNIVFYGIELGINALGVLTSLTQGNIYLPQDFRYFEPQVIKGNKYMIDNILCDNQMDLEEAFTYGQNFLLLSKKSKD